MSVKTRNFTLFSAAFAAVFLLAATFSACESTLGFGKAIDFVLPELTLDPGPNPQYVTYSSTISGKITDNIAVGRVILRDADDPSGKELFTATLSGGNNPREKRWSMALDFREVTLELKGVKKTGEELNGERIGVEVVGYDQAGNSHIVAITLIIDMRDPYTTDIFIERTSEGNTRTGFIEPIAELKDLETTDPNGFISANANKYQNGQFTIKAKLDEDETRIKPESVRLNIWDEDRQNQEAGDEPLLSLERDAGSTIFSPSWPLLDENIVNAGTAKSWTKNGISYANAYHGGKRFYYRVEVVAIDESGNELHDDMGWFCMWQDGDIPKGVLDPSFGGDDPNTTSYVDRGTPLPVEFFDDDALEWAYAGLLTKAQWEGTKTDDGGTVHDVFIASGVKMPQFTELTAEAARDEAKLKWLKERLKGEANAGDVYNWRYDIYYLEPTKHEIITDVADIGGEYEKTLYIETGNQDSDYGEFVLFTLTADRKLPPHDPAYTGPIETLKPRWKGRAWKIQVIDSNAPLIVFDTVDTTPGPEYDPSKHPGNDPDIPGAATGDSPEENTFPRLSGGRFFEINGYTLRENGNGHNSVNVFRLAWLPYGNGAPDALIAQVQNALSSKNYPDPDPDVDTRGWPAGVQHWDLHSEMVEGTPQPIGGIDFRKQVFRKKFDVLGGKDDLKPEYYNFKVGGEDSEVENETKLFIFYAKDNAGHGVFRQLRLLGNKSPPNIIVYDLTNRSVTVTEGPPNGLPDLNNPNSADGQNYYFFNTGTGLIDTAGRARYEVTRKTYQQTGFNLLKAIAMPDTTLLLGPGDIASTNAAYPRETVIKYWVTAQSNGDLAVENVLMRDITFADNPDNVGHYDENISLSYIEKVSEVTQRVFLFEATDSLGNVARIQRTVAVTNAAVLNSITTTTQTGAYGIGTIINLQANFSNLVRWEGTNPPLLNVRYNYRGISQLRQIATTTPRSTASLSLVFPLTVEETDTGVLETIYFGIPNSNGHTAAGTEAARTNRPITVPAGTSLLDSSRGDDAFTPRNSAGFDWTTSKGSLQASKTITLQGVRPVRDTFTLTSIPSGKTRYTDGNPGLFYKADETVEFTLKAANNVAIFTGSVAPIIQFQVNNAWYNAPWARAGATSSEMVFSVLVNAANVANNGGITAIRLNDSRSIVDSVGNAFVAYVQATPAINISTDGQVRIESYSGYTGNVRVTIDKVVPTAPTVSLPNGALADGTSVTTIPTANPTTNTVFYRAGPTLTLSGTGGETAPVARTEYSLDGGVSWTNYTAAAGLSNTNGAVTLQARFTDRAGNIGTAVSQLININAKFPDLKSITAVQPDGFYPRDGATLQFDLAFDAAVWTNNTANATITLVNRNAADNSAATRTQQLTATAVTRTNAAATIRFAWTGITVGTTNKEMLDGLYVSAVNFTGLSDRFGNPGGNGTAAISGTTPANLSITIPGYANNTCTNLSGAGLKVDCIAPTATYNPLNEGVLPGTGNSKNRTITLTFNEKVIKGSGTITVKPRGTPAIPAVFENNGYYLGTNGTRYANPSAAPTGVYTTYVDGFYDIYNKTTTAAQKNGLAQSSNATPDMNNLTLNTRSSQTAGPYIRTTHGLKEGAGYTGNWTASANGPNPEGTRMVPDTATKWVLDYRYLIDDTTAGSVVTNIRATLNAIKFRWQEIDVTSGNVSIGGTGANEGRVVTINLPEPLLDGLQWDLYYPAGTFTDEAGNNAPAIASAAYWFWSSGVQTPVIRVNRRSYDARTSNWAAPLGRQYNNPALTNNWNTATIDVTNDNGWSIFNFNTVHYRIETETPTATLTSGVLRGTNANNGAVNGAWTGNVQDVNTGVTTNSAWNNTNTTSGTWIRPNLVRRAGTAANRLSYTVTENGITLTRQGDNTYQGFRSYNKDPTKTELDAVTLAAFNATNRQGIITFSDSTTVASYEASKNYVIARATRGTYNATGYEGVFRSVIMLNQASFGGNVGGANQDNNPTMVQGSNIRNGMPSIAGFPVRDAEETGDNRYIKLFYRVAYTQATSAQLLWVSTEIVSQWYELNASRLRTDNSATGGTHQNAGEVNNYLSAGYGDLTYSYNQR